MLRSLARKADRVVTFVAALEMARQQWVGIEQLQHLGPIELEQLKPTEEIDLDMLAGWVDTDQEPA